MSSRPGREVYFRTSGRKPSQARAPRAKRAPRAAPPPKERAARRPPKPAGPRPTKARAGVPHTAWGLVPLAGVVAVIAAVVATIVYAAVDAGRPLVNEPTTVAPAGEEAPRGPGPSEDRTTTTKQPEDLTPDQLRDRISASVRSVRTLDEAGQPVQGTAFVAGSFGGQSLLLTSLAVVRSSTREPAPPITLGESRQATLWTWQEDRDLALLTLGGTIETLPFVSSSSGAKVGDKLYTVNGDRLSTGTILAVSPSGVEHNLRIDDALQGAPLVNQKGEVVAMASRAYNPGGRGTETVFIGVPVSMACERVLQCGGGNTAPGVTTTRP